MGEVGSDASSDEESGLLADLLSVSVIMLFTLLYRKLLELIISLANNLLI